MRTLGSISLFRADNYVCAFDLKSGYYHVDIYQEHWRYIGFS